MTKVLMVGILCAMLACPASAWEQKRHRVAPDYPIGVTEGPALGIAVAVEPCISVAVLTRSAGAGRTHTSLRGRGGPLMSTLSETADDRARFYATAGPGNYDADRDIILVVSSNVDGWAVAAQATPLDGDVSQIPGDRVYAWTEQTDQSRDDGVGPGYVSIGVPEVVATGSQTEGQEVVVRLRLETTYNDKAGTYTGAVYFIYLMEP